MMIRRYIVKDIPEAVVMIRRELGKDAVILDTRKVWTKRWFGLLRSRRVEVVAATGDDVPRRAMPSAVERPGSPDANRFASTPPNRTTTADPQRLGQGEVNRFTEARFPVANGQAEKSVAAAAEEGAQPTALANAQPALHGPSPNPGETDEVKRLWNEISELKQRFQAGASAAEAGFPRLQKHLITQGLKPEHAEKLTLQCERMYAMDGTAGGVSTPNFESVRQTFVSVALEAIGELAEGRPLGPDSRVIGFVGPTGVGKTTTIAKLAALHVLEGKRKVGLLTTDTFRIAAVDQLRTYANILNIPLQVVYQNTDLPAALEALADRDLILVDTAGRNFSNNKHITEMQALLDMLACDEVHLVLSLTSKTQDLTMIAEAFRDLAVSQVVLTKLDETRSYGAGLNLLLDFRRPLSYITMGQNVPDDIAVASTEKLLRLTAGGARF